RARGGYSQRQLNNNGRGAFFPLERFGGLGVGYAVGLSEVRPGEPAGGPMLRLRLRGLGPTSGPPPDAVASPGGKCGGVPSRYLALDHGLWRSGGGAGRRNRLLRYDAVQAGPPSTARGCP